MLKIRMQRGGRIKVPSYRIVVTEHARAPKAGNVVEQVGSYNAREKTLVLDGDRIKHWLSVGAQPSDTVHNLLVSKHIISAKKINVLPKNKNRKSEPVAEPAVESAQSAPAPEEAAV